MNNSMIIQDLNYVVTGSLREEVDALINSNNFQTDGQLLLSLCKIFRDKVEIKKREYLLYGKYNVTAYSYKKKDQSISDSDLMVYGAQLIYTIRKFLNNGEEIFFHFGAKDSRGKFLADAFIPQKEVLRNLSQVTKEGIGVTLGLQKELISNSNMQKSTIKFTNQWKRVEYLADPLYLKGKNIKKEKVGIDYKTGEALIAYQSQKQDNQVYIRYSGKSRIKYYKKDQNMIEFNDGWLWEWYDNIYNSKDEIMNQFVEASLRKGSILPIIQNKDWVPGTKQGDYQDRYGRQIQNKYNNAKIISFNNILKIMEEFTVLLESFLANSNNEEVKKSLLSLLKDNFIPSTVQQEGKIIENIIDNDILSKLLIKST